MKNEKAPFHTTNFAYKYLTQITLTYYSSTVKPCYNDMVFAQNVYRYTANIVITNDHYSEDYE